MKGYYRIDKYLGFELWENEKYGDEVPAKVTHNGVVVGETYNSLQEFVEDYMYE